MKKAFILSFLGYLGYLYLFHVIFLPHKIFEFGFVLISGISLLYSIHSLKKKKYVNSLISINVYALSFSFSYFFQIFIRIKYHTINVVIMGLIFIFFIISFAFYYYYLIRQFSVEEINKQKYIHQIKKIYGNYIYNLRHDYNEELYQVINDININNIKSARNRLKKIIYNSYQNLDVTISNSSSLNHMFQVQLSKYKKEGILFQYFLCKIENDCWDTKYTIFIHEFLEKCRIQNNEIVLYIQKQPCYFVCKIISNKLIKYNQHMSDSIYIMEKQLTSCYEYVIKMPISS